MVHLIVYFILLVAIQHQIICLRVSKITRNRFPADDFELTPETGDTCPPDACAKYHGEINTIDQKQCKCLCDGSLKTFILSHGCMDSVDALCGNFRLGHYRLVWGFSIEELIERHKQIFFCPTPGDECSQDTIVKSCEIIHDKSFFDNGEPIFDGRTMADFKFEAFEKDGKNLLALLASQDIIENNYFGKILNLMLRCTLDNNIYKISELEGILVVKISESIIVPRSESSKNFPEPTCPPKYQPKNPNVTSLSTTIKPTRALHASTRIIVSSSENTNIDIITSTTQSDKVSSTPKLKTTTINETINIFESSTVDINTTVKQLPSNSSGLSNSTLIISVEPVGQDTSTSKKQAISIGIAIGASILIVVIVIAIMLFRKKHCWHRKNKDGTDKIAMEGQVNQNGTQNNNITTQNGHAPKIILPRGSLFANQDPKMEPGNSIINNQGKVSPRPSINERLEPRDVGTFQESYINEPEGVAPNEPIYMDPPDLYNMVKELENQSSDTDQIQKTKETPPQCDQQVRPDDCKNQMIDESTTSHPYNCIGEEETPKNHESLAPEDPNDSHPYNRLDLDIKNTRINDRPEIKPPNDYNGLINPIYHKVDDPNTIPLSPVINYSGDNEGTIGGIDNGNGDKHYEITLAENEEDDKNAIGNISTNENDADNKHYEISLDENEGDNDDNEDHNNGANKHYEISLAGIDGDNENFEYDSIDEDDDVGNKNNELNNADKIGKISPVHEFSSDEGSKTLLGSMERKKEELYVDLEDPEDDDLYEVSPKDVE